MCWFAECTFVIFGESIMKCTSEKGQLFINITLNVSHKQRLVVRLINIRHSIISQVLILLKFEHGTR